MSFMLQSSSLLLFPESHTHTHAPAHTHTHTHTHTRFSVTRIKAQVCPRRSGQILTNLKYLIKTSLIQGFTFFNMSAIFMQLILGQNKVQQMKKINGKKKTKKLKKNPETESWLMEL